MGKGFALKTGFKFIKDHLKSVEAVVTIDADGQHTVGDTKKCLQEYERNAQKYPLILGSRNFGKNIPLEQVWAEIRKRGFKNKVFRTLEEVIDKLQEVILSLHWSVLKSIVNRRWTRDIYFLFLISIRRYEGINYKNFKYLNTSFRKTIIFLKLI
ncbi:hypothetical protein JOA01_04810 [Streptococcus parasuis]|nr:hypothetical protein [Streptococcus parasuis]QXF06321.1 hypothetical protein JOA01_04810 [Streptococcus parasuis]